MDGGGNRTPAERAFDGWWGEIRRPRSGRLMDGGGIERPRGGRLMDDFRKNNT